MKKIMIVLAIMLLLPAGVQAYQVIVTDPANDQIGDPIFDTTRIEYNVNTNPLIVNILTNYQKAGFTVGTWKTQAADLILWGEKSSPPAYAIPLVDHGIFLAGRLYKVSDWYTSDEIAALNGISSGYIWGFGENVWIKSGEDTGYAGAVAWGTTGVTYTANNWYWTDTLPVPGGDYLAISWATATCANDVVEGTAPVPEPATMLLLGSGLVGLAGFGRKKLFKK